VVRKSQKVVCIFYKIILMRKMENGLNGKKKSQGCFSNGTVYGQWTYWHESGQKESKGGYIWFDYGKGRRIVKDDNWIYWDEDGNKKNIFQDNQE